MIILRVIIAALGYLWISRGKSWEGLVLVYDIPSNGYQFLSGEIAKVEQILKSGFEVGSRSHEFGPACVEIRARFTTT
jgi:hypothetical protein